jgi:hypothetical protein
VWDRREQVRKLRTVKGKQGSMHLKA